MTSPLAAVHARLAARLHARAHGRGTPPPLTVTGQLTRMVGLLLEAGGVQAVVGARCQVRSPGMAPAEAEVVGFSGERVHLMPLDNLTGLAPGARVVSSGHGALAPVGEALLGRVIDGTGRPLDGRGPLRAQAHVPLAGRPVNPLSRAPVREPLGTGVRAIDALLTVGRGQRIGLFAGSGVGKSVLLGMMTRHTEADVTVVGLIGERGREVADFVRTTLGAEGLRRAVVVAAPADAPPLQRLQGAMLATTLAEYFRDRGQQVLLLMDSLTRFAQAQRELALAVGEPPATRGYPPSVFARLPALVERAGTAEGRGAVTAFYTVLTEGDDPQDPVADAARAILDGHILLSRELADGGHYPAIEIESSISRVMADIAPPAQLAAARRFRRLWSAYRQQRDLIAVGAYQPGTDPLTDAALARWPALTAFARQDPDTGVDHASAVAALAGLDLGESA